VFCVGKGYDKWFIHPILSAWLDMHHPFHDLGLGLKIGDLTSFQVIAAGPDEVAYLVDMGINRLSGLLPREYASREYTLGEYGWASVFEINSGWFILSRTSPQFIRKTLEYLLRDFLDEHGIRFKKAARIKGMPYCKVACKTDISRGELAKSFCAWRPGPGKLIEHVSATVFLVKYSLNIEEYVVNALVPAPLRAVKDISYSRELKKATVYVEPSMVGRFLGWSCWNVSTAAKLTGVAIEVIGVK